MPNQHSNRIFKVNSKWAILLILFLGIGIQYLIINYPVVTKWQPMSWSSADTSQDQALCPSVLTHLVGSVVIISVNSVLVKAVFGGVYDLLNVVSGFSKGCSARKSGWCCDKDILTYFFQGSFLIFGNQSTPSFGT